jgi:hypothetical protein
LCPKAESSPGLCAVLSKFAGLRFRGRAHVHGLRPAAPAEKTSKRGVYLIDSVWDRLQYEAIRRKTTVSAIAGDVLDRNLPRFQVTREG